MCQKKENKRRRKKKHINPQNEITQVFLLSAGDEVGAMGLVTARCMISSHIWGDFLQCYVDTNKSLKKSC